MTAANSPAWREEAFGFDCAGERLVGVVTHPAAATGDLALLVVVGGPQVRTGSHRQFTQLCRTVAASGVPAVRFDVRGMGDSSGALHTFEHIGPDIGAALDALQARLPGVRRVVLWGLCDGASAALMHVHDTADPRVAGLVLLNPWVRSVQTLARAHVKHYYWNRLRQGEFWRKMLGGGVALKALRDLAANLRAARSSPALADHATATAALPFQERMLRGAEGFAGPVLWVLSGQDYTAKEFVELLHESARWQAATHRARHERLDLAGADHTFSDCAEAERLAHACSAWLARVPHHEAPAAVVAARPAKPSGPARWDAIVSEHGSTRVALLYVAHRVLERLSGGYASIVPYLLVAQPIGNRSLQSLRADAHTVVRQVQRGEAVTASFPRSAEVIDHRFASGSTCYAAWVKGRFAGHIWIAHDRYEEDEVRCTYRLAQPDSCVWDYDVYVEPELRHGRTLGRLWRAVDSALGAEGKRFTLSRINRFASESVRSHMRLGARSIGRLLVIKIAGAQLCLFDQRPFVHVSLKGGSGPLITLTRPTSTEDP